MLPYLITFTLSLVAYSFAIRSLNRRLRILLIVISILLPTTLAGLHDPSLGLDWYGYGIDIWEIATNIHSFNSFLQYYPAIEPGYKLLNYAISFISSDYHVFFFFHQLILASIAVFVAYFNRNHKYSEIILIFYFLYMYNTSINIIRQSLALMMFLLAYTLWDSHYRKSSYSIFGISLFFHTSAVFAFPIYIVSAFKHFLRKYRVFIITAIIWTAYYTINSYTYILTQLIDLNIFSGHYIGYADQVGEVSIHKTDIAFQAGIIILLYCLPSKVKNKEICFQISMLALMAITLNLFGNITDIAFRVAHYFILPIAILMPRVSRSLKVNQIACIIFAILLASRFLYFVFSGGAENTVPYKSMLLGI